jgi:hypothetical protein
MAVPGTFRLTFASSYMLIPTLAISRTLYPCSRFLPIDIALASWLPVEIKSALAHLLEVERIICVRILLGGEERVFVSGVLAH